MTISQQFPWMTVGSVHWVCPWTVTWKQVENGTDGELNQKKWKNKPAPLLLDHLPLFVPPSRSTSRDSSIPEATWNASTPRALNLTLTTRCTSKVLLLSLYPGDPPPRLDLSLHLQAPLHLILAWQAHLWCLHLDLPLLGFAHQPPCQALGFWVLLRFDSVTPGRWYKCNHHEKSHSNHQCLATNH